MGDDVVRGRGHARLGLMGNPADAVGGPAITVAIGDLFAEVEVEPSGRLRLIAPPSEEPDWENVDEMLAHVRTIGHTGGRPLMTALISRVLRNSKCEGLSWPPPNFTLRWKSNIPPRVGLGGSSALLTAAFRAVTAHWGLEFSLPEQVKILLNCETKDLRIPAGPQDRVAQVYGGVSFLEPDVTGRINVEPLDPSSLPPLFVVIDPKSSEGTEVFHGSLRTRCEEGDATALDGVKRLRELTLEARDLLREGRGSEIGPLMDENFDIRERLTRLNPNHVEMIAAAREFGAHAKFTGSGGSIVGTCDESKVDDIIAKMKARGWIALRPKIVAPTAQGVK